MEQLVNSPIYDIEQQLLKEYNGCIRFGSLTRSAFGGLHRLADYNLNQELVGIGIKLMKLDKKSEVGKRNLKLSVNKNTIEGFSFNRNNRFEKVLQVSLHCKLDRESLKAVITVPRINTEMHLRNKHEFPYFRLKVVMGCIPDMFYHQVSNNYKPVVVDLPKSSKVLTGKWHSTKAIVPEHNLTIQISEPSASLLTSQVSVLLCIALVFGEEVLNGDPSEANYGGSGKVMAVR